MPLLDLGPPGPEAARHGVEVSLVSRSLPLDLLLGNLLDQLPQDRLAGELQPPPAPEGTEKAHFVEALLRTLPALELPEREQAL